MSDKRISELNDGLILTNDDYTVISRNGANFKLNIKNEILNNIPTGTTDLSAYYTSSQTNALYSLTGHSHNKLIDGSNEFILSGKTLKLPNNGYIISDEYSNQDVYISNSGNSLATSYIYLDDGTASIGRNYTGSYPFSGLVIQDIGAYFYINGNSSPTFYFNDNSISNNYISYFGASSYINVNDEPIQMQLYSNTASTFNAKFTNEGNLLLRGYISATTYYGDGSNLTGIPLPNMSSYYTSSQTNNNFVSASTYNTFTASTIASMSGTTNYIPVFNSNSSITNSIITQSASDISVSGSITVINTSGFKLGSSGIIRWNSTNNTIEFNIT